MGSPSSSGAEAHCIDRSDSRKPSSQLNTFQKRRIKLFTGNSVEGPWRKGALIGKGATGAVYEAFDENTGSIFAVKEIEFVEDFADIPDDRRRFESLKAEVTLLQQTNHPNVVRFLGVDRSGFNMYLMMEFVAGGNIQSLVKRFKRLPEPLAAKYTLQLIVGLSYLHRKNIIHRDVKGANILVSDDGVVKLADFGAAKQVCDPAQLQHTLAGTPYWMAPEVVRQEGHGKPADVWSLGATALQMLTGLAPYQDLAPVPALFRIGHCSDSPIPENATLSEAAREFIGLCLNRDASQRPLVEVLAMHPWLARARAELRSFYAPCGIAFPFPAEEIPCCNLSSATTEGAPTMAAPYVSDGEGGDEEGLVMEYIIALSFTHDDTVASDAVLAAQLQQSVFMQHAQGAVTFDDNDASAGPSYGTAEESAVISFDQEQFDVFIDSLRATQQSSRHGE